MRTMDIISTIGEPAALEQLAEEASELAQAALKKARILRGENPTPVSLEKAEEGLAEEYADLEVCAVILGLDLDTDIMREKMKRWENRLKERVVDV